MKFTRWCTVRSRSWTQQRLSMGGHTGQARSPLRVLRSQGTSTLHMWTMETLCEIMWPARGPGNAQHRDSCSRLPTCVPSGNCSSSTEELGRPSRTTRKAAGRICWWHLGGDHSRWSMTSGTQMVIYKMKIVWCKLGAEGQWDVECTKPSSVALQVCGEGSCAAVHIPSFRLKCLAQRAFSLCKFRIKTQVHKNLLWLHLILAMYFVYISWSESSQVYNFIGLKGLPSSKFWTWCNIYAKLYEYRNTAFILESSDFWKTCSFCLVCFNFKSIICSHLYIKTIRD